MGTDAANVAAPAVSAEARVQEMYSRVRYPSLDPGDSARYVRHRRAVYALMGMDAGEAISGGPQPAAASPVGPAPGATQTFFGGKVVLDAGCGTGEETLFLAGLGAKRVIGIDTSDGSLEVARAGAARLGLTNVEFHRASVLDSGVFAPAAFDYVSSLGCIHHTPDMSAAFANLCAWVRPGGHLCTFIYNSYGHFVYNLECRLLDRFAGQDVERRVRLARRLFDWRGPRRFRREGIAAAAEGRLYDKYGVLYRESLTLGQVLGWYRRAGFVPVGSYPMYLKDMVAAACARDGGDAAAGGWRGRAAHLLDRGLRTRARREWTWSRRAAMQLLVLGIGMLDYGSAFRVLGRKEG
ncbi:MAG: class I SAM-dependent methyltransferase [Candidatus Latescibacterota bacterium]